jgi:hypothetical protein
MAEYSPAASTSELIERKELREFWSRGRELNSRPADYESAALPLSYLGAFFDNSIRAKFLSIERQRSGSSGAAHYRENGYMAQPIPTPMSKNRNKDQMMYLTRSFVRRRLRNPNAMEMSSAKSVIA